MIEINLLPEEERKRKKELSIPKFSLKLPSNMMFFGIIGAVVLLLIIVTIIHFSQVGTIKKLSREIEEKKTELRRLEEEKKRVENMKEKEALINQKIETIQKLTKGKFVYPKFLDLITMSLPDYMWLEDVVIRSGVLTIKGKTFSNLMITDFLASLKTMKEFIDPNTIVLKDIINKVEDGHDIISFELNCKFLK